MSNVREILIAARELISDPARWTQGASARTRDGNAALVDDPSACSWCALGATAHEARRLDGFASADALRDAIVLLDTLAGPNRLPFFNDHGSHESVLALFDRAIEATSVEVSR